MGEGAYPVAEELRLLVLVGVPRGEVENQALLWHLSVAMLNIRNMMQHEETLILLLDLLFVGRVSVLVAPSCHVAYRAILCRVVS